MSDALLIFLGLLVLLLVAAVFSTVLAGRPGDEGDLEHFDHDPGDPAAK